MAENEVYICDADCLINLHRAFGSKALRCLRKLAHQDSLKIPEGVLRELKRVSDKLRKFAEEQQQEIEVTVRQHPQLHTEIPRLEQSYGEKIRIGNKENRGFWGSKSGRRAADAQVVAVGKLLGGTVVSDDEAVKSVCSLENVPCIGWLEFARRLGLSQQPRLTGLESDD